MPRPSPRRCRARPATAPAESLARCALLLELSDQRLRMQRGDQVAQRLRPLLDELRGAVCVDIPAEALPDHLDLLLDELLHRTLVAERVVDREADPLVVSAR